MPVTLADGPLGIEARHKWIDAESASVLATLGDLTSWPNARIRDISGLFDFPEMDDNSEPRTESWGALPYPSRARTKNVTYTVEVRGKTLQSMRAHGAALRAAFGPDVTTGLIPDRIMIITPHPSYETVEGNVTEHAFRARCIQYSQGQDRQDRSPSASPTPYVRTVVIGLKLYDPRIYEWDPDSLTGLTNPKW